MSDNDTDRKAPLKLSPGKLELKKPVETGQQVRQSFSHGRSKVVTVEVRKKRHVAPGAHPHDGHHGKPEGEAAAAVTPAQAPAAAPATPVAARPAAPVAPRPAPAAPATPVASTPAPAADAPAPAAPVAAAPVAAPAAAAPAAPVAAAPVAQPRPAAPAAGPRPVSPAPAQQARPASGPAQGARPNAPAGGQNRPAGGPSAGGRPQQQPMRGSAPQQRGKAPVTRDLTSGEKANRAKVLQEALLAEERRRRAAEEDARRKAEEARRKAEDDARRAIEEEARRKVEEEARRKAEEEAAKAPPPPAPVAAPAPAAATPSARPAAPQGARPAQGRPQQQGGRPAAPQQGAGRGPAPAGGGRPAPAQTPAAQAAQKPAAPAGAPVAPTDEEDEDGRVKRSASARPAPGNKAPAQPKRGEARRREGKLTITAALDDDDRGQRGRSLASVRRARERERLKMQQKASEKVIRDVVIPETITVQELANRMAERGADVIKCLMRNGIMATINQVIDADTAELVVSEFGHNVKRVADSDVEIGLVGDEDHDDVQLPRPPVVTVMGHVDHGKTSLLDALRSTDVVSGEAGGITQHIGAYQVTLQGDRKITFIDTPGHEAFTAMRARGAKVTDIVVLVVAADDGIMPQTVEAIRHARAAKVPIIVAINKIDKPQANPDRVRQELLQHELVTEDLGGDVMAIEVSAKKRMNLDALEEAILLQAEVLELKANPHRSAQGVVIEAKMERGRGSVATVLVQRGTLRVGDVFVAGSEWGRVRALVDAHGEKVEEAGPATPVEVLGLQGTPSAGDDFITVDSENRAREVADYRQRKDREAKAAAGARGTLEQMFSKIAAGEAKELPVVIKGDVQGSVEAIVATLGNLGNDDVKVRVLHAAVGGINESDVTLAKASNALMLGFNVRANPQARELARRDSIDIRYYSIIYDLANDLKTALTGMLDPTLKEAFLGNAEIREVFNITKVGKVAGCMVTEGIVKRGAKVRLLRDNVVVHTGALGQLKRFKDDAREVREGFECGMSFENYNDIQVGDIIECYEIEEVAATL